MKKFFTGRRLWPALVAGAIGIALLAIAAGDASVGGWTVLRPTFNGLQQHIRYMPGTDTGYGHGYNVGDNPHVHDPATGQPVQPPRDQVITYGNNPYHPQPQEEDGDHHPFYPSNAVYPPYATGVAEGWEATPYSAQDGVLTVSGPIATIPGMVSYNP